MKIRQSPSMHLYTKLSLFSNISKVLETYDIIFKCIGTQRLSSDLFTYGAGLFPLLTYAAINVKPVLLSIYENHFVNLGRHIKPALSGVLLGLLPGLEEGSEFYSRFGYNTTFST